MPIFELKDHPHNEGKEPYYFEQITDRPLGQMYMIDETALIASSSDQILFFKLEFDEVTKETNWINYHTIPDAGQIFFIKGNQRF